MHVRGSIVESTAAEAPVEFPSASQAVTDAVAVLWFFRDTVLQPPRPWFRLELVEKETYLIGITDDNSCLTSQSRDGLRFYHLAYTTYGRGQESRGCSWRLQSQK